MVKEIILTNGRIALVDDEDFDKASQHRWYLHKEKTRKTEYVMSTIGFRNPITGKVRPWFLHQLVLGFPSENVDHKNRNGLDNQKSNLRICNVKENSRNRGPNKGSDSGYKGVSWSKAANKWKAKIGVDGKQIYLGCFAGKGNAAKAYNRAALKYHGEFAYLNPIHR